jgi:hypothetical protein
MLVIVLIMATGLQRSGLPGNLAMLMHGDFENFRHLVQFDSLKVREVQKEIAGFWMFAEGDTATSPVAKREYMEIVDNGMLWQVNDWFINKPSGGRSRVTQVKNGFVNPYSYTPENDAWYVQTRIIRQIFVADSDTCYGTSQVDEIWIINKNEDGTIRVNYRDYEKYAGELTEFFPDGDLLDIVDKITMRRCASATSIESIAKRLLARSLDPVMFFQREQAIDRLINKYYRPIVLDELVRLHDPRTVPDELNIRLTIGIDGAVTDIRHRQTGMLARLITRRFDERAIMDMNSWLFPAVIDASEDQRLEKIIRVRDAPLAP